MKIFFTGLFLAVITGCAGFSQQPLFTDISGLDIQPVKLVKKELRDNNTLYLYVAGEAELTRAEVFMPKTKKTASCSTATCPLPEDFTVTQTEDIPQVYSLFSITPDEPIGIGEPFIVRGSISDTAHTVLDFTLPLEGTNTRPAQLRMSELRPFYSSKPKSEFIECIVTHAGNLAGITITNVGTKEQPDYVFPAAEVKKGEVVVFHWRSVEEGIRDETDHKIISKGTQACPTARDFWGSPKSIPKRNANVILIKTQSRGAIQDAVLYCTKKEFEKRKPSPAWNDEILNHAAEAAAASGIWHGSPELSAAVITEITASKSLVRKVKSQVNNADAWFMRDSKKVTMGKAY